MAEPKPKTAQPKPGDLHLTVVIPARNERLNLEATIRQARKIGPVRIVVCDGDSTDETPQIARRWADVVCKERRGSIAAARNEGAFHAGKDTDLLLFIDADTRVPHGLYRRIQDTFQADPLLIMATVRIMPEKPTWFEALVFNFFNSIIAGSVLVGRPCLSGPCVVYRRGVYWTMGGFDEGMAASEDLDLSVRASRLGRAAYWNDLVAYTSKRRLIKLGWLGLLWDWGKNSLYFLFGKKVPKYRVFHDVK